MRADLDARAVATLVVGGVEKLALAALRGDAEIERSGFAGPRSNAKRCGAEIDLDTIVREATNLHAIGTFSDRLQPD